MMTILKSTTPARWQQAAMLASSTELLTRLFQSAGMADAAALEAVLTRYPDLKGLTLATEAELARIPFLGSERAALITHALALSTRALRHQCVPCGAIVSSEDLGKALIARFAGAISEEFLVFYLNVKNQVIYEHIESRGGISSSMVDNRVILRRALLLGASRLIVCHNHPSGDIIASNADEGVTNQLQVSAQMMGIELLDHLIIGRDNYLSFREEGIL